MVSSVVTRRLGQIEEIVGDDGECPRCSNTMIIRTFGAIIVVKGQRTLGPEASRQFAAEAESNGGRCPVCEQRWIDVPVQLQPSSAFYQ